MFNVFRSRKTTGQSSEFIAALRKHYATEVRSSKDIPPFVTSEDIDKKYHEIQDALKKCSIEVIKQARISSKNVLPSSSPYLIHGKDGHPIAVFYLGDDLYLGITLTSKPGFAPDSVQVSDKLVFSSEENKSQYTGKISLMAKSEVDAIRDDMTVHEKDLAALYTQTWGANLRNKAIDIGRQRLEAALLELKETEIANKEVEEPIPSDSLADEVPEAAQAENAIKGATVSSSTTTKISIKPGEIVSPLPGRVRGVIDNSSSKANPESGTNKSKP